MLWSRVCMCICGCVSVCPMWNLSQSLHNTSTERQRMWQGLCVCVCVCACVWVSPAPSCVLWLTVSVQFKAECIQQACRKALLSLPVCKHARCVCVLWDVWFTAASCVFQLTCETIAPALVQVNTLIDQYVRVFVCVCILLMILTSFLFSLKVSDHTCWDKVFQSSY